MSNDLNLFDGMVLFTQVVNNGGFSAASLVNGHSTSYISKEINKLETRLGVRLLHRTTRKISLTPEGEAFFKTCDQMIIDAEQALAVMNQVNVEPRGVLKISCPIGLGVSYLTPILSKYMELYPQVKLDLDFDDRHVDVVQEGYDLAIRATSKLVDSSLVCKKLSSFKAHTIASSDYLKKHGTPKVPADLSTHQCLSYGNLKHPTKWVYETFDGKFESVEVPATVMCNSGSVKVQLVLQNKGICRLPEFYIEQELKSGQLIILFKDYKETVIDLYALYPSRKHLSAKVRKLIDLMAEHLPPV